MVRLCHGVLGVSVSHDLRVIQRECAADHLIAGIAFEGGECGVGRGADDPDMADVGGGRGACPAEVDVIAGAGNVGGFRVRQRWS